MERPGVGVAVVVVSNNGVSTRILLGKRLKGPCPGVYAPPGGHLEMGESWKDCAARELKEETGIIALRLRKGKIVNWTTENKDTHYVTISIIVPYFDASDFSNKEPEKHENWNWYPIDELPTDVLGSFDLMINGKGVKESLKHLVRNSLYLE